ncbi:hypothetical protein GBA52_015852 [Prunus armeniaca]|nr:hypothetical protein GBA52_015852 [Prunus armeniaca]
MAMAPTHLALLLEGLWKAQACLDRPMAQRLAWHRKLTWQFTKSALALVVLKLTFWLLLMLLLMMAWTCSPSHLEAPHFLSIRM